MNVQGDEDEAMASLFPQWRGSSPLLFVIGRSRCASFPVVKLAGPHVSGKRGLRGGPFLFGPDEHVAVGRLSTVSLRVCRVGDSVCISPPQWSRPFEHLPGQVARWGGYDAYPKSLTLPTHTHITKHTHTHTRCRVSKGGGLMIANKEK